jgi:hypothetical protein
MPAKGFEHSSRARIKHIALAPIGTPEHARVQIMNPIGAAFGMLGNLIEYRRAAGAGEEMQTILAAAHYDYRLSLTNAVTAAMGKVGFEVARLPGSRPEKQRSKFLTQYPQVKHVDAYLDVYSTYVGFEAPQSSVAYGPRLEITARLVSAKGHETLYQNRIVYSSTDNTDEDVVLIRAADNLSFRDRASLQADPVRTARALQAAVEAVAWELAQQFK